MKRKVLSEFLDRYEWLLVILLFMLGAALRFVQLGALPAGLNQDEASAGYEAWSLYNYGIDRNGYSWPVLLRSWGSGQNALYTYLTIPFVAGMGLTELSLRLPGAITGSASLILFWAFARRCRGRGFAMTALLFLAVNPWHIMISRWALESNLLPFFLLAGIYFTSLARDKSPAFVPAGLSFALSLYAYGTGFIFVPVFLIASLIWLARCKAVKNPWFVCGLLIFAAAAFPIALCQLRNAFGLDGISIGIFSLPRLSEGRQMATTVLGGGGLRQALSNYKDFLRLLWTQSDMLPYNSMYGFGLYYFFGLPLAALGLVHSMAGRRDAPKEYPMLFALGISVICSCLISININRINMAFLPLIYFAGLGLHLVLCRAGKLGPVFICCILLCCGLFFGIYRNEFYVKGSSLYYPGLGEAILYADSFKANSVFITDYVQQPYIFALFYTETPPEEYIKTAEFINPGAAFESVKSFGRYSFGSYEEALMTGNPDTACIYILHESQAEGFEAVEQFGQYIVCVK